MLKLWVRLGVAVRLPVKLGVLDPVDEREAVMVFVNVLDGDEPAVAVLESVRVGVSVAEREAAARERVRVAVIVGVNEAAARERVAVIVGVNEAAARERVGVAVGVNEAPARERVTVAVAETEPAGRERVPVAEIERPAGREREGVAEIEPAARGIREREGVAEIEPAARGIREREAVAVTVPLVAGDGIRICPHPDETAKAKKNTFLIMFMIITLTPRNLFYIISYPYLRADCFHEVPQAVH